MAALKNFFRDKTAVITFAFVSLVLGFTAAVSYHDPGSELFKNFTNSRIYFTSLAFSAVIFSALSFVFVLSGAAPSRRIMLLLAVSAALAAPFSLLKNLNFFYAMAGAVFYAMTAFFVYAAFSGRDSVILNPGRSLLPALIMLCSAAGITAYLHSLSAHYAFHTKTYDTAFYENTIWLFSRFLPPFTLTGYMGLTHDFGMHVEPVLYLIGLLYRIYPSTEMLYLLQALAVFSSPVIMFLFVKKVLRDDTAAFLIAAAFCISPYLIKTVDWDFHPITFYPFFLLGFLYFAESRRFFAATLLFALSISVKEEIPVYMFFITVFSALRLNDKRYYILSLFSAAAAYASIKMVIPALSNVNFTMGSVPLEALQHLRDIVTPSMLVQLAVIFASTLFLALKPGRALFLVLIPAFMLHIMNYRESWHHCLFIFHYSAAIIPVLFVTAVYNISSLENNPLFNTSGTRRIALFFLLCQLMLMVAFYPHTNKLAALFFAFLVFAAAPAALFTPGIRSNLRPVIFLFILFLSIAPSYLMQNGWRYRTPSERAASLKKAVSMVPASPDIPVMASDHLTSHLSRRKYIMMLSPHMLSFAETPQQIMINPVMHGFREIYIAAEKKGDDFLLHWDFTAHYRIYRDFRNMLPLASYTVTELYSDEWVEVLRASR